MFESFYMYESHAGKNLCYCQHRRILCFCIILNGNLTDSFLVQNLLDFKYMIHDFYLMV